MATSETTDPFQTMESTADSTVTFSDVPYLAPGRSERLDIHVPPGDDDGPSRPVLLFLHGGAFYRDDKCSERSLAFCRVLVDAGYVVVNANYALSEGPAGDDRWTAWPQNLLDCRDALAWVGRHAAEHGADPRRTGIVGLSAGATIALILAAATDAEIEAIASARGLTAAPRPLPTIRAIVNGYGRADFLTDTIPEKQPTELEMACTASPVRYLQPGRALPPVITLHGTDDAVVPFSQAQILRRVLRAMDVTHEFHPVTGAGHSFSLDDTRAAERAALVRFLDEHLR